MINWEVRIRNRMFWITVIPAIILVIQAVGALFGFALDLGDIANKLIEVVNSVFAVLVIMGVVVDPTTKGVADSSRAMTYHEPK